MLSNNLSLLFPNKTYYRIHNRILGNIKFKTLMLLNDKILKQSKLWATQISEELKYIEQVQLPELEDADDKHERDGAITNMLQLESRLAQITPKTSMKEFESDPDTDAVVLIGEIGGVMEIDAAHYLKENMKKPVIGYIAGLTAPKGRRMGHAGAIISAYGESAAEKIEILQQCGVIVVPAPSAFGETIKQVL